MLQPSLIILYVDHPKTSGDFYGSLLRLEPVETSPTFVLFVLPSGLKLGLWSKHTVEPRAAAAGGGTELAMAVDAPEQVDSTYDDWKARGLAIAQPPTDLDFGRTFVAVDPDGHRLRVFALGTQPAETA